MLKDQMIKDLTIFFNNKEFAKTCIYKSKEVSIIWQNKDLSVFEMDFETIKGLKSDFEGLELDDNLTIDDFIYRVTNFHFKDEIVTINFVKADDDRN